MGQNEMGFVKNGARLQSGGVDYTIATPWTATQAQALDAVQSVDVIFAAHRQVAPRRIMRNGETDWSIATVPINPTVAAPTISSVTPRNSGDETYAIA